MSGKKTPEISKYEEVLVEKKKNKEITPEEYKNLLEKRRTNTHLDGLQNDSNETIETAKQEVEKNLAELRKYKKNLLEQAESKVKDTFEDAKTKASEKVDEVVDKAKDSTKKMIEEKIPGTSNFFDFFSKIGEVFKKTSEIMDKKGFLAGISIFFSLLFGKISLDSLDSKEDDKESEKTVPNEEDTAGNSTVKLQEQLEKEEKVETSETVKEDIERIKKKESFYYHAGAKTLLSLSLVEFENNTDKNNLLDKYEIKNSKYNKFINLDDTQKKEILKNDKDKDNKETLNKLQEGFKNEKVETLINYYFKSEILESIINSDGTINENLKEIFGGEDRLNEILKFSKENVGKKDWWKNELTIKEISIIYSFSFNFLKIPAIKGVESTKKTISGIFNFDTKEIAENSNFMSKNIINFFTETYGFDTGSKNLLKKDDQLKKDFLKYLENSKLNDEQKNIEIKKLNKLIEFKNNLLSDSFLTNQKLGFDEIQREKFKSNLDYKWLSGLFGLLNGNTENINNIGPLNSLSLAYFNSEIIGNGKGNTFEGKKYLTSYMYKAFLTDSIFTEEEQKVIEIYSDKFLDYILVGYNEKIGGMLGIAAGLGIDMGDLAIGSGVTGITSILLGKKLTKIGANIEQKTGGGTSIKGLGHGAKWLGVLGLVLSAVSYKYYFSNNNDKKINLLEGIQKALKEKNSTEVIKLLKESDKIMEKSIKNFEIKNKKGEKEELKILDLEGKKPRIFYKGEEYSITIIDKSNDIKNGVVPFTKTMIEKLLFEYGLFQEKNSKYKINGKLIDSNKIKLEGENIIFGENNNKISFKINELFKNIDSTKTQIIAKSQLDSIKDTIENMSEEYDAWGEGEHIEYKEIKNLGNYKSIVLVKL